MRLEIVARMVGLTDESVCPTLLPKDVQSRGAGAFACHSIFSRLLRERLVRLYRNKSLAIVAGIAFAFLLFGQAVPDRVNRYPSPDDLVVSPDGKRLYVVDRKSTR